MKKKFIKTPLKGVCVHGAKDVGTRTVNLLMGEHAGEYVRGDIMDANAVIQAFDELKGNVDNDHDSLEEVVDELHNLRDATDQSFEVFQEKAEKETADRIQGDKTLDEKIDQKERESKERDNVLQQNIDTEKQERVNADTQLRNDLNTEINRAKAKENVLASDIQAEATKRENDDNTIKDNLNAEVTRATAKENEIKAEVDVINGDSTTEGSFRKAIADVVGAAPEAYDTLKEIADKLNENDDLHAAINDAIATKATTVALNEEITRAKAAEAENKAEIAAEAARAKKVEGDNALAIQNETSRATTAETAINEAVSTEVERSKGQEAYLQNLINTKADTTALEGAKTELDEKISNLKFIPYNNVYDSSSIQRYQLADKKGIDLSAYAETAKLSGNGISIENDRESLRLFKNAIWLDSDGRFKVNVNSAAQMSLSWGFCGISAKIYEGENKPVIQITNNDAGEDNMLELGVNGITLSNGDDNHVLTSNAGTIDITEYAKKTELPTVPTKLSQLTNDSNFITAADVDFTPYATIEALAAVEQKVTANTTAIANINKSNGIPYDTNITNYYQTDKPFYIKCDNDHTAYINPYSGIKVASSDTSYVDITPVSMRFSNGDASCELNQYLGMQYLLGTSDDSYGFKLSPYGLRIGKKSDINANNNELIYISRQFEAGSYTFKVEGNSIENNRFKVNEFCLTNDKDNYNGTDLLYLTHSAQNGAIRVGYAGGLSIGDKDNISTSPYWKFDGDGAEFNGFGNRNRIRISTGHEGLEYANIYGIKLKSYTSSANIFNNPCEIENNEDYVSFSKKIKVSDIVTDATTDSSLNTVLSKKADIETVSKKVDTEAFNSFTSYVSGQFNSLNGALSNFGGQIALKQDKITPTTELDLTSIDTADIESLRSIVKSLATELNTLGLIKLKSAEETA